MFQEFAIRGAGKEFNSLRGTVITGHPMDNLPASLDEFFSECNKHIFEGEDARPFPLR